MIRFLLVLLVALAAAPVRAQTPFYQGKTITIIVGTKAGDAYDLYPRMLAEFMPKYIPGNPTVRPENMPGAGSLRVAKWLDEAAPRDGTAFGTIVSSAPSRVWTRIRPERQTPMWWYSHSSVFEIGLIDSLQRHPGWRIERPMRISPMS